MLILYVPILLLTWKMGGFKQKVLSSKLFIRSRYEYLEMKAEMLISCLIFIFWCQTQMFSVYSKNKGIGLTVPILFEGSVYIYIYIDIWRFNQNIFSIWKICFLTLCWFPNIFRMYLPYRKYVLVAFRHSSCWRISCLNDCLIWIYAPPKSMVVF